MGKVRTMTKDMKKAAKAAIVEARKMRKRLADRQRRMEARTDPVLIEWIKSMERRIEKLEADTSPHRDWI